MGGCGFDPVCNLKPVVLAPLNEKKRKDDDWIDLNSFGWFNLTTISSLKLVLQHVLGGSNATQKDPVVR